MRPMKQNAMLVILSAGMLGLVGCNFDIPSSEATKAAAPATGSVAQQEKIIVSTSSPTAITRQAVSKGDEDTALPYEEIKRTIVHIVYGDEQGKGPEMGEDGIVDPKIREAFGNYNGWLRDKEVHNWSGWLGDFTQANDISSAPSFNLGLFMQEPRPSDAAFDGVLLLNVPLAQLEKLGIRIPKQRFGSWEGPWPKIVFSGTIVGTFHNGRVLLDEVTINSVE